MAIYKSNGSISFNGEEYMPDENGFVTVPDEAIYVLQSHGLEQCSSDPKAEKKKADKKG